MRISDWSSDVCSSDLRHFLKILGPLRRGHDDVAEADLGLAGCILDRSVLREHGRTQACDRDGEPTRRTLCLPFPSPKSTRSEISVCAHVRKIGRAHVYTPVTNAQIVCRLLLAKQNTRPQKPKYQ